MKNALLIVVIFLFSACYSQGSKSNTIQDYLRSINIELKGTSLVIDTLLKHNNEMILSVIDSVSVKEEKGEFTILLSDRSSQLWYIGKFGRNAQLPALFEIVNFPNNDELIIMRYIQMGQGITEESITLFIKTHNTISQICPTILETGIANSGLCPDIEKCYEYKSILYKVENNKITFNKKGTLLIVDKNIIKSINEFFYIKLQNGKWNLIKKSDVE
jgi:hypothetical protein